MCRSPVAAAAARRELARRGLGDVIKVASAGVSVPKGMVPCPTAVDWAKRYVHPDATPHQPCLLEVAGIEAAALVLGADRDVCSQILRLAPAVRPTLFTLREAAALAAAVQVGEPANEASPGRHGSGSVMSPRQGDDLAWMVQEMNAMRGRVPVPQSSVRTGVLRRKPSWSPYDIPDAHGHPAVSHQYLLPMLEQAAQWWVDSLARHSGVEHVTKAR